VIVVETLAHLKIYLGILDSLPAVKAIAVWGVDVIPEELQKDKRVYTFRAFLELGKDVKDAAVETAIEK